MEKFEKVELETRIIEDDDSGIFVFEITSVEEDNESCELIGFVAKNRSKIIPELHILGKIKDKFVLKKIRDSVFSRDFRIREVFIPEGVEVIGSNAFNDSHLTKIHFPNTLKSIYENAFYNCLSIEEISFPNSLRFIDTGAFSKCYGLKEVDLSNTKVTSIPNKAFKGCFNLKKATIRRDASIKIDSFLYDGHFDLIRVDN